MRLVEKTPKSSVCVISACPAIFETDCDTYVVIGTRLSKKQVSELLKDRVGAGEVAVEFPKVLLEDILRRKR